MRGIALLSLLIATTAAAQDSSFSRLRARAAAFRLPVNGDVATDWRAGTGGQLEIASNVGRGDLGLAVGHVRFTPRATQPSFTETFVSLAWTTPLWQRSSGAVSAGARLTDVRMNFDDPAFIAPLRREEEVLISGLARGHATLGRGFSAFIEASYGAMMLSTTTPVGMVALGIERDGTMPGWLRGILR